MENQISGPLQALVSVFRSSGVFLTTTVVFLGCLCSPSSANTLPSAAPAVAEATENETAEEKERFVEEYLEANPDDVDALKALLEVKVEAGNLLEAISAVDRLAAVEPAEKRWPLTRAQLLNRVGDVEAAVQGFEEILAEEPLSVEAYQGLVSIAASQSQSFEELDTISRRIESAMARCRKEKRKEEIRDFRLLMAQIKVIRGQYDEALKVYQELVKEEPRDFRPYLCQGVLYTLMRKKVDAEKQFEKCRRLVPRGHPYTRVFGDNVLSTNVFSRLSEKQGARR
ncbi:SLOW GREEN 1 protein [Nymphaea thermarum]|nr:SLOW GREEN 1 protein [Nymphaea thermarum]